MSCGGRDAPTEDNRVPKFIIRVTDDSTIEAVGEPTGESDLDNSEGLVAAFMSLPGAFGYEKHTDDGVPSKTLRPDVCLAALSAVAKPSEAEKSRDDSSSASDNEEILPNDPAYLLYTEGVRSFSSPLPSITEVSEEGSSPAINIKRRSQQRRFHASPPRASDESETDSKGSFDESCYQQISLESRHSQSNVPPAVVTVLGTSEDDYVPLSTSAQNYDISINQLDHKRLRSSSAFVSESSSSSSSSSNDHPFKFRSNGPFATETAGHDVPEQNPKRIRRDWRDPKAVRFAEDHEQTSFTASVIGQLAEVRQRRISGGSVDIAFEKEVGSGLVKRTHTPSSPKVAVSSVQGNNPNESVTSAFVQTEAGHANIARSEIKLGSSVVSVPPSEKKHSIASKKCIPEEDRRKDILERVINTYEAQLREERGGRAYAVASAVADADVAASTRTGQLLTQVAALQERLRQVEVERAALARAAVVFAELRQRIILRSCVRERLMPIRTAWASWKAYWRLSVRQREYFGHFINRRYINNLVRLVFKLWKERVRIVVHANFRLVRSCVLANLSLVSPEKAFSRVSLGIKDSTMHQAVERAIRSYLISVIIAWREVSTSARNSRMIVEKLRYCVQLRAIRCNFQFWRTQTSRNHANRLQAERTLIRFRIRIVKRRVLNAWIKFRDTIWWQTQLITRAHLLHFRLVFRAWRQSCMNSSAAFAVACRHNCGVLLSAVFQSWRKHTRTKLNTYSRLSLALRLLTRATLRRTFSLWRRVTNSSHICVLHRSAIDTVGCNIRKLWDRKLLAFVIRGWKAHVKTCRAVHEITQFRFFRHICSQCIRWRYMQSWQNFTTRNRLRRRAENLVRKTYNHRLYRRAFRAFVDHHRRVKWSRTMLCSRLVSKNKRMVYACFRQWANVAVRSTMTAKWTNEKFLAGNEAATAEAAILRADYLVNKILAVSCANRTVRRYFIQWRERVSILRVRRKAICVALRTCRNLILLQLLRHWWAYVVFARRFRIVAESQLRRSLFRQKSTALKAWCSLSRRSRFLRCFAIWEDGIRTRGTLRVILRTWRGYHREQRILTRNATDAIARAAKESASYAARGIASAARCFSHWKAFTGKRRQVRRGAFRLRGRRHIRRLSFMFRLWRTVVLHRGAETLRSNLCTVKSVLGMYHTRFICLRAFLAMRIFAKTDDALCALGDFSVKARNRYSLARYFHSWRSFVWKHRAESEEQRRMDATSAMTTLEGRLHGFTADMDKIIRERSQDMARKHMDAAVALSVVRDDLNVERSKSRILLTEAIAHCVDAATTRRRSRCFVRWRRWVQARVILRERLATALRLQCTILQRCVLKGWTNVILKAKLRARFLVVLVNRYSLRLKQRMWRTWRMKAKMNHYRAHYSSRCLPAILRIRKRCEKDMLFARYFSSWRIYTVCAASCMPQYNTSPHRTKQQFVLPIHGSGGGGLSVSELEVKSSVEQRCDKSSMGDIDLVPRAAAAAGRRRSLRVGTLESLLLDQEEDLEKLSTYTQNRRRVWPPRDAEDSRPEVQSLRRGGDAPHVLGDNGGSVAEIVRRMRGVLDRQPGIIKRIRNLGPARAPGKYLEMGVVSLQRLLNNILLSERDGRRQQSDFRTGKSPSVATTVPLPHFPSDSPDLAASPLDMAAPKISGHHAGGVYGTRWLSTHANDIKRVRELLLSAVRRSTFASQKPVLSELQHALAAIYYDLVCGVDTAVVRYAYTIWCAYGDILEAMLDAASRDLNRRGHVEDSIRSSVSKKLRTHASSLIASTVSDGVVPVSER
eukprot:Rmarinus@m.11221